MARIIEAGRNRASADEAASFVDKFEEFEAEILSERGKFMAACKVIREKQKELLDDAKAQGVKKSVVKAIVKARLYEAKAKDTLAEIEDDEDQVYAIDIRKALGDDFSTLPLGAAAVEREDGKPKQDAATAAIIEAFANGKADKPARDAKH